MVGDIAYAWPAGDTHNPFKIMDLSFLTEG
jgi:hypothetical protein